MVPIKTKERLKYKNKHSGTLHEFYSKSTSVNIGTAKSVRTGKSHEVEDELIQPSHNDQITLLLPEPNIKVDDNCYEIPVPMKTDVINVLLGNFYFNKTKGTKSCV